MRSRLAPALALLLAACDLNQGEAPQTGIVAFSAGRLHTCAVRAGGATLCWGDDETGQLGDGQPGTDAVPEPRYVAGPDRFASVIASSYSSCAVTAGGQAYCWGIYPWAQHGNEFLESRPVAMPSSRRFETLAIAGSGVCGLDAADALWCIGYIADTTRLRPVLMDDALRLTTFSGYCGISRSSEAWCYNYFGDRTLIDVPDSVDAPEGFYRIGGNHRWSVLDANGGHACGVADGGKLFCWGNNPSGQTGADQSIAFVSQPREVAGAPVFQSLTLGAQYSCGLTAQGEAWCWGLNSAGQLGADATELCGLTRVCRWTPAPVATAQRFTRIDAGDGHACGLTAAGALWCWGANSRGQLGDGTTARRDVPVEVFLP